MSKVYNLKTVQFLPISIEKAWDFFSSPTNLSKITPAELKFKILSTDLTKVYAGQVIEYKVHPVLGIPLYWMTEITHVEHHKYFVDDQRYGPYSMWHHQHHFKVVEGGVEMTDIVHYKLPFWIFGDIANTLFVKAKLKEIFDYRIKKVAEIF
jgi:ligand-binding SRPBCC domain-containing protein